MAKFKLFGKEGFFTKIGRRNLIIAAAILAVGAAVWVNYAVFYGPSRDVGYGEGTTDVGAGSENEAPSAMTYFTSAQLSRQQAREEALEVLQSVVANPVVVMNDTVWNRAERIDAKIEG